MKEIEIKASRRKFTCTNKDKIMYNGSCYQLMTQTYREHWTDVAPVISEREFKRLQELGVISDPYEVTRVVLGIKLTSTWYDFKLER